MDLSYSLRFDSNWSWTSATCIENRVICFMFHQCYFIFPFRNYSHYVNAKDLIRQYTCWHDQLEMSMRSLCFATCKLQVDIFFCSAFVVLLLLFLVFVFSTLFFFALSLHQLQREDTFILLNLSIFVSSLLLLSDSLLFSSSISVIIIL